MAHVAMIGSNVLGNAGGVLIPDAGFQSASPLTLPAATNGGAYFYQMASTGQTGTVTYAFLNTISATVTNITQGANAVITVSTVSGTHPFLGQTQVYLDSLTNTASMFTANPMTFPISSLGGSSGAWTITTTINTTNQQAYASGSNNGVVHAGAIQNSVTPWQLTPQGYLFGAPTTNETASITIEGTDSGSGLTWTKTFTLPVNSTLAIMGVSKELSSQPLPQAMIGNKYFHQMLPVAGGSGTIGTGWSDTSGVLSGAGLAISSTGAITGTPTGSARTLSGIALKYIDNASNNATATFNLALQANANVSRPSYNSSSSNGFFVLNGQLYDPNGAPFRIRGTNRAHYTASPQPGLNIIAPNAVRMFTFFQGTTSAAGYATELTNSHINFNEVAIMCNNVYPASATGTTPSGNGATSSSTNTTNFTTLYTWLANNFSAFSAIQGSMILNIANEWGPSNSTTWRDSYIAAVGALRTAGWTCPLLIDAGIGVTSYLGNLTNYSAAVFNADPLLNCIFAFHTYGLGNAFPPGSTQAENNTIMSDFATLQSTVGACYIIGEFADASPPQYPDTNWGSFPSPTTFTFGQSVSTFEAAGIGWLGWAWDDTDLGGAQSSQNFFSYTTTQADYTTPSTLQYVGLTACLNPAYGINALATPASSFL
jgi:Cellulase (glycosyl hydrolase family 5)